jgi:hypothetical protein
MSQTTSHYPLKHADTTQEETAAPGKLPETPLRMDPDLLYDNNDEGDDLGGLSDQMQTEAPLKESISSYSVSKLDIGSKSNIVKFLYYNVLWT